MVRVVEIKQDEGRPKKISLQEAHKIWDEKKWDRFSPRNFQNQKGQTNVIK